MEYKIVYTLKERVKVEVSPYTGKVYKKPRVRAKWVSLSEKIEAPDLANALERAKRRAKHESWQLEEVSQI